MSWRSYYIRRMCCFWIKIKYHGILELWWCKIRNWCQYFALYYSVSTSFYPGETFHPSCRLKNISLSCYSLSLCHSQCFSLWLDGHSGVICSFFLVICPYFFPLFVYIILSWLSSSSSISSHFFFQNFFSKEITSIHIYICYSV